MIIIMIMMIRILPFSENPRRADNNNDNNNDNDDKDTNANVYGAIITAEPLREFTRFI